jgi:hypothetical protein
MAKELRSYEYPFALEELKARLLQQIPALYSLSGPLLIFDREKDLPLLDPGRRQEVAKVMDEGFTYGGKFYQSRELEIELTDLLRRDLGRHWREKLRDFFHNQDFHLLEDGPDRFLLVKGSDIFEGEPAGPGASRLRVRELAGVARGPLKLSFNPFPDLKKGVKWWQLLRIEESPVIFEKSLPQAVENPAMALRVFYLLQPGEAEEWERQL